MELEPALKLLCPPNDVLMTISQLYEPKQYGANDNVYISKSYDPSSHFESTTDDVKDIYKRVTGHDLVLKQRKTAQEEAELAGLS